MELKIIYLIVLFGKGIIVYSLFSNIGRIINFKLFLLLKGKRGGLHVLEHLPHM